MLFSWGRLGAVYRWWSHRLSSILLWLRSWWCPLLMAQVWMLIYLLFLLSFCFRPTGPWCKTCSYVKLCNNTLYSDICCYILITINDVTSCIYCGIHVGAPGLLFKLGVTPYYCLISHPMWMKYEPQSSVLENNGKACRMWLPMRKWASWYENIETWNHLALHWWNRPGNRSCGWYLNPLVRRRLPY
jgi:hypothetical protein